jgi:hypothetical protein
MTTDSTKTAAIDRQYHWLPIDKDTPIGVKVQLINKAAGVASYGAHKRGDTFYTHWSPLPTFKK